MISLILSLILLFSTTVPAFASDDLSDILNENGQEIEEISEIDADEPEEEAGVNEPEEDEADVYEPEEDEADVNEPENDGNDGNDGNDENDVVEPKENEAEEEETPEASEDSADAPVYKLDMPKVSRLTGTAEGIEISWRAVSGAQKYRVLCLDEHGEWMTLADTAATSYIWADAKAGNTYVFTVCCISSDGKTYTSDFDKEGMAIAYEPAQPEEEQTEVGEPEDDGEADVEEPDEGEADVDESDEGEANVEESGEGEADLEKSGEVKAVVEGDPKALREPIATLAVQLNMPTVSELVNTPEGVTISWKAIAGADKYRVFRLAEDGNWAKLGDTASTNYTWTEAKDGNFYVFTVRCISSDGKTYTSDYDKAGMGITYTPTQIKTPELISIENTAEGVKLTWKAVLGAQKYRVFYKNDAGIWAKLDDTTATSYTWGNVKNGGVYTLTVRCVSSDGKTYTSGYDTYGKSIIYRTTTYPAPTGLKATNTSEGVILSWNAVPDVKKYRVFYKKTITEKWLNYFDTTATSYTWTGAPEGVRYYFTVRCLSADGKTYVSGYQDPGEEFTFKRVQLGTPSLSSATSTPKGVAIAWDAVPDAKKYRVFYKGGGVTAWKELIDTASTNYTWTGAKSGTQYTFTVRCVTSDGKVYVSGYDTTGVSVTYMPSQLKTPMLTSLANTSKGVAISWEPVPGAEKYRVFCKNESGVWTKIDDTTSAAYIWTDAEKDVRYTFTVRCVSADGKTYTSDYDTTGLSILYRPTASEQLATPGNLDAKSAPNGVAISWDAVTGAEKYRVFYKDDNGEWAKLVDTTSTTYTWTGATSGEDYSFTVRCVSADGKLNTSGYSNIGVSISYTATSFGKPHLTSVDNTPSGMAITWEPVDGAQKYRVFYKINPKDTWMKLADTSSTIYTWDGARSGITYYFTVRCLTSAGSYAGGYEDPGLSETYTPVQLKPPTLLSATSDPEHPNHVTVSWDAVSGAEKYRVFYKSSPSGVWEKLADTASTSYTWTGAEGDRTYSFTVRCLSSDGKSCISSYDPKGVECVIGKLEKPEVTFDEIASGLKISWQEVAGAYKYHVLYKKSGEINWKDLVETTDTSYLWADALPNTEYTITVYCVSYDGSAITSEYNELGWNHKMKALDTPKLTSVSNVSGGVEITWDAVPRAQKYRVFYLNDAGIWAKIDDTTSTSYTWTGVKPSTKYTFTVRCITADGANASDYDRVGKSITTLDSRLANIVANGSYQQSSARSVATLLNALRTSSDAWYWNPDGVTKTVLSNPYMLIYNNSLEKIAMHRAAELVVWYSNKRPDNSQFTSLEYDGVNSECEIIVKGYSSAQAVFDALAAADKDYSGQADRRILLSSEYTAVGAACFEYGGTTYWVLEFKK